MKKSVIALIVVILILLVGGGILLANRNGSHKQPTTTNMPGMHMTTDQQPASTTPNQPAGNAIAIRNFAFSPADVTVKVGTTLTWMNKDSVTHTVTEDDGQSGPDSGDLAPGKSYSFTFDKAGTFKYHCSIHTDMTGTVTVTD